MRLEHVPIILGALIGILGIGLVADAWMPDHALVARERRRRQRAERHRGGEALVGIGTLCLAAALIGRDTWRYGTLAVLIGTVFLIGGVALDRAHLREVLFFRGPARRAPRGAAVATDREMPLDRGTEAVPRAEPGSGTETSSPPRPRIR